MNPSRMRIDKILSIRILLILAITEKIYSFVLFRRILYKGPFKYHANNLATVQTLPLLHIIQNHILANAQPPLPFYHMIHEQI